MNDTCSIQHLKQALAGTLSAADESSLQLHLDRCESCAAEMDRLAGGEPVAREIATLLKPDEFGSELLLRDDYSTADFVVEHLEPSDEPEVLGRLGGYDVVDVIGRGGMGVVLKSFDPELKRIVAIKALAPHLAHSAVARKRFAREAQAAAAVVNPHVIAIHQVQPNSRLPFIVMPLLSGESLAQRLQSRGTLELEEILRIGVQAAEGLAAAHAQGLIHRDVKPANILLEKGVERVVLTDFGLARSADDVSMTRMGVIAGTPEYMSPEQARGETLDCRSDLFSMGCLLYEMATGVSPFRTESPMATMRRLVDENPRPLASLNPQLPPWFIRTVERLLEKDPSKRFESAEELGDLLGKCLAHVQQPNTVPLPDSVVTQVKTPRLLSIPRRSLGVIVMISVVGLSLLGMLVWQGTDPPDIAGKWSGKAWGTVVLKARQPSQYEGSYSVSGDATSGTIKLSWSRMERRFNGTWMTAEGHTGRLSLRVVGSEIRGAWSTDQNVKDTPGRARLGDFALKRTATPQPGNPPTKPTTVKPKRIHHFADLTHGHDVKIASSPDGRLIAITNGNPSIILKSDTSRQVADQWQPTADILDARTGKIVVSLKIATADENAVLAATPRISHIETTALAFSPDGNVVAVGTSIGQIKLFNARTGELLRSLDDEEARLADKETPENWNSLKRAIGNVQSLAFSPNGGSIAVCGGSFADFSERFDGISRLGFRGTGPGRLKLWDVQTGTLTYDLVGHNDHANAVSFSPDGRLLASAGRWSEKNDRWGNGVILWNARTGQQIRSFRTTADGGTRSITFSPDSKLLVIGTQRFGNDVSTGGVSTVQVSSGITQWLVTVPGWAKPMSFAPDGMSIAVLCGGRSIRFLEIRTGTVKHELRPDSSLKNGWKDFAISANGATLVIGGVNSQRKASVEVWSTRGSDNLNSPADVAVPVTNPKGKPTSDKSKPFRQFNVDTSVWTIACTSVGKLMAVANGAKVNGEWTPLVDVLDATTRKTILSLKLTTPEEDAVLAATKQISHFEVQALAFSPDGKVIAVGTSIGQVKLFDAATGALVRVLDDQTAKRDDNETPEPWQSLPRAMGSTRSLAFSADGTLLATCGDSFDDFARAFDSTKQQGELGTGPGRLKVWNLKSGTLQHDLVGHSHAHGVSFSPKGTILASGGRWLSNGQSGTGVIMWDTNTGKKVRTVLTEAEGSAESVAFSPDGTLIAINSRTSDMENTKDGGKRVITLARAASGIVQWQRTMAKLDKPVAFFSDAVAVIYDAEAIRLLSSETGAIVMSLRAQTSVQGGRVNDFSVATGSQVLATGGVNKEHKGTVEFWDFDR